jgi:hypothetical protein
MFDPAPEARIGTLCYLVISAMENRVTGVRQTSVYLCMDTEGIAAKPIYSALITLVIIFALAVMILQPEVFVKQS